jgi:hypothetical protein
MRAPDKQRDDILRDVLKRLAKDPVRRPLN